MAENKRNYNNYSNYNKVKKEHAFKLFQEDIKEDKFKNLVLFCGVEDFLIDWAVEEIIKKYVNPATKTMDCDFLNLETAELSNLIESCETIPMFSEKRVVIVKNYQGEFEKKDSIKKEFVEYIQNLPSTTFLVITTSEENKTISKYGTVYNFEPLEQRALVSFVRKRFKEQKKLASDSVIKAFINECGYYNKDIDYNLYNLKNDVIKIAALNGYEPEISLTNVRLGISDNLEHGIFSLLDAVSSKRKADAFSLLHQIILSGYEENMLLASIIGQLEIMYMSRELAEQGKQFAEIAKLLKVHEYRVKKALEFTRRYSSRDIKKMLILAYDTDIKFKSGVLEPRMALEMLVAQI